MSSREIAELTNKRHPDVTRDTEKMLTELGEDVSRFAHIYMDSMNRQQTEYLLDRELTETLLTGYSAVLRRKVIARWRELEALVPAPSELSRMQILEIAMESERERVALAAQVAAAAPAVEFVSRYVESTGLMTFRQVAKLLQIKEPEFRQFLHAAKIMYPLNGEWTAHAQHIEAGRFEVRAGTAKNDHAYSTAKFTAKGVEWVAGELAKWQLKKKQMIGEVAHA